MKKKKESQIRWDYRRRALMISNRCIISIENRNIAFGTRISACAYTRKPINIFFRFIFLFAMKSSYRLRSENNPLVALERDFQLLGCLVSLRGLMRSMASSRIRAILFKYYTQPVLLIFQHNQHRFRIVSLVNEFLMIQIQVVSSFDELSIEDLHNIC